jgi:hypothetical protein
VGPGKFQPVGGRDFQNGACSQRNPWIKGSVPGKETAVEATVTVSPFGDIPPRVAADNAIRLIRDDGGDGGSRGRDR